MREMAENDESQETFGETIRRLRRETGLTQRQLAGELQIDFTYLSKLENGRGERPSERLVRGLARRLDTDAEELLALAGRVPEEIGELAQNDLAFARLLRRLPQMDKGELEKIYKQAKVKPSS
ncbi:MAG: helix-turn-helix transcriptional regulator [Solirubrobacterales bacterium]